MRRSQREKKTDREPFQVQRDVSGSIIPIQIETSIGLFDIVPIKLGYHLKMFRNGGLTPERSFKICMDHTVQPNLRKRSGKPKYNIINHLSVEILRKSGFWTDKNTGEKKTRIGAEEISLSDMTLISYNKLHTEFGYKYIGPDSLYRLTIPEIQDLHQGSSIRGRVQREKRHQDSDSKKRGYATQRDRKGFQEYLDKHNLR